MVDVDELIVPRHPDDMTWTDMIQRTQCGTDVASYQGRHILYRADPNNTKYGIVMLDWLQRSSIIYKSPERSKCFAYSLRTNFHLLTHTVEVADESRICVMPVELGGNHHYRKKLLQIANSTWLLDQTPHKYMRRCLNNLRFKSTDNLN